LSDRESTFFHFFEYQLVSTDLSISNAQTRGSLYNYKE
jgi:hypothetical protein